MTRRPAVGRYGGNMNLSRRFFVQHNRMSCRFPRISIRNQPNLLKARSIRSCDNICTLGLSSQASVNIECGSFPWPLDQLGVFRNCRWDRGWREFGVGTTSGVHGQSPFREVWRGSPKSWIRLHNWQSILPAFSHMNAINYAENYRPATA